MIFLAGPHGAGKTKSAEILRTLGYFVLDLGPTLRTIHRDSGSSSAFGEWVMAGEKHSGPHFTDALLAHEIMNQAKFVRGGDFRGLVGVGSRSARGIQYMRDCVQSIDGAKSIIVFIDAPLEILRERYNRREGKSFSVEEFTVLLQKDVEIGLETIRPIADFHIVNVGGEEELKSQIKSILDQIQ